MNKIIFIIAICFITLITGCEKKSYTINGKLTQVNASTAYLIHINPVTNSVTVLDSTDIENGYFTFNGSVDLPIACQIKIGRKTTINIILENSDITLNGTTRLPEEIKIKGSKNEDDFRYLVNLGNKYSQRKNIIWNQVVLAQSTKDSTKEKDKINELHAIEDSIISSTLNYIEDNSKSIGCAYYVYYLYLDRQFDIQRLSPLIKSFDESLNESEYIKYLKEELLLSENIRIGGKAPSFTISSLSSDTITLESYKGQYLFIDFTASWCPGREKRNKKLENLFKKWDQLPLRILTIYIDKNQNYFHKHINPQNLSWDQSVSFKYWEDPITKYYGVNQIPYGVLINPHGEIIKINPAISSIDSFLIEKTNKKLINISDEK